MQSHKQLIQCCKIAIIMLISYGCQVATPLKINIHSAAHLNRSQDHKSLPVRLKIYQLSEPSQFEQALFEELWKHEKTTLAESFISVSEKIVGPNSHIVMQTKLAPATRYIGVVGTFRNPSGRSWRTLIPVPQSWVQQQLTLQVKGNQVYFLKP